MAARDGAGYTGIMSAAERTCAGVWGLNLACAAACNARELGHAAGVLLVFAATWFLFAAPIHAALAVVTWTLYRLECRARPDGAAHRACLCLLCAESALFWGLYWAMACGIFPLNIRL